MSILAIGASLHGCLRTVWLGSLLDGSTGGCLAGPPDGGCTSSGENGCCVSTIDCSGVRVCSWDSGSCLDPPQVTMPSCLAVGSSCGDGGSCCGTCADQMCQTLYACGEGGDSCSADRPCCADYFCSAAGDGAGTCVASCGAFGAPCSGAGDCCSGRGLVCLSQFCGFPTSSLSCSDKFCTPVDAGGECTLGSACAITNVDPCLGAGLVCGAFGSCRQPTASDGGEPCLLGGPSCTPVDGSLNTPVCYGGTPRCVELCAATSDCAQIDEECDLSTGPGTFGRCVVDSSNCIPFDDAGCSLDRLSNGYPGTCIPDGVGRGKCQEVGGGVLGDGCDLDATKHYGALCDQFDYCVGGTCLALCNAGRLGPSCALGQCVRQTGMSTDSYALGVCSLYCSITDPDGGGCVSSPGKPQKCLPSPGGGVCVGALVDAGAVGSPCDPTSSVDQCVAGAHCFGPFNDDGGGQYRCIQLCLVGATNGCSAGLSCDGGNCLPEEGPAGR